MRVLQVVPGIAPAFGGPSVALTSLARALTNFGVDTTLLTTNASPGARLQVPLNEEVQQQGARYIFHNVISLGGRYGVAPRLIDTLVRTISTYDIVHIHWLFNFSCIATAVAASLAGIPFVVQPNASLDPYLRRKNRLIKNTYLATLGRPLLTWADAIVFTSDDERRMASYGQRREEWIIPVGLEAEAFADLPQRGVFRAAFPSLRGRYLLFLGRLSRQKGLDLLIGAFAVIAGEDPDLSLVVAGPDPEGYGLEVRRLVEAAGLTGRVHLPGMLSHELKLAAFVDASLFVLPSYAENFGAVVTESLACGLPVLLSDRVNIHREIVAAGAGVAVPASVEAVAEGIRDALGHPERLAMMATAGRALVRDCYTWDAIVPQLVAKYEGLVQRARARVVKPRPPPATVAQDSAPGDGLRTTSPATNRPLRILQVISSISPEKGGPSKAVIELSRTLAQRGHEVTLLTTDLLDTPDSMLAAIAGEIAPATLRWFHASTPRTWGFSMDLGAALWAEVRHFDVVHIHSLYMFHTLAASMACRRRGVPYLIRPHGTLDPFLLRRNRLKKVLYTALIEKRNLDHAAAIHYTSDEEMRLAHATIRIRARPVVVPLGVDPGEFEDLPDPDEFLVKFPEMRGKRIILFLSRINFKKGLDVLIAAFSQLQDRPDLHLVLAGPEDPVFGRQVRKWVVEYGVAGRTTFTGMLMKRDKLAALASASVFVLPSYAENFGFAVVEALAAGVPTVISDHVHLAQEISRAGAAAVCTCRADEVATQIRRVLDDPTFARQLRVNGPLLVRKHFTWAHVVDALVPVYRDAIVQSGVHS